MSLGGPWSGRVESSLLLYGDTDTRPARALPARKPVTAPARSPTSQSSCVFRAHRCTFSCLRSSQVFRQRGRCWREGNARPSFQAAVCGAQMLRYGTPVELYERSNLLQSPPIASNLHAQALRRMRCRRSMRCTAPKSWRPPATRETRPAGQVRPHQQRQAMRPFRPLQRFWRQMGAP